MPPPRGRPQWAQQRQPESEQSTEEVPDIMLWQARKTGTLRLVARNIKELPAKVYNIYNMKKEGVSITSEDRWWECEALTKLDVSSNHIAEIGKDISQLVDLVYLDLHDNELTSLPVELSSLLKLTSLHAHHNKISSLPPDMFTPTCILTNLHLQHNALVSLPPEIGYLASLQILDLSHNRLESLPTELCRLKRLRQLDVSHNRLAALPAGAQDMISLAECTASDNQLTSLHESWASLPALERLVLIHNEIAELYPVTAPVLKELSLGNNKLSHLAPGTLTSLTQLQILDLRKNRLVSVPADILSLTSIERLVLADNDLTALPPQLCLLPQLKVLLVEGNAIRTIRRDILTGGTTTLLKYLETRLKTVPAVSTVSGSREDKSLFIGNSATLPSSSSGYDSVRAGSTLTRINHSNKGGVDVSVLEGDLGEVKEVHLSGNELLEIPAQVLMCAKVETLDCSLNLLKSVPPNLWQLRHLTVLNLARNELVSIDFPDAPTGEPVFPSLQQVVLSQNRLAVFPGWLVHCPALNAILVDNNKLTRLEGATCRELARLPHLQVLDLNNNDIAQVPPELGLVSQLRMLKLEGNTFRVPRYAILQKGTTAVLEYLRNMIPNP